MASRCWELGFAPLRLSEFAVPHFCVSPQVFVYYYLSSIQCYGFEWTRNKIKKLIWDLAGKEINFRLNQMFHQLWEVRVSVVPMPGGTLHQKHKTIKINIANSAATVNQSATVSN
jgi:hypothetical protein